MSVNAILFLVLTISYIAIVVFGDSTRKIFTLCFLVSALAALFSLWFHIQFRGHGGYCGLEGCFSFSALNRYLIPAYIILFVKYGVVSAVSVIGVKAFKVIISSLTRQ
ncbi:MAG: hypothetical protein GY927_03420 [bacterium]|nr:hypothetical protein [bacterium]